ncbi:peptide chain release factor N(5)-glutamine methyltransferase [Methylocystis sp.]|uniref:peptide chain release factor N(5)-glutamine methyltransferase n=1 Tax=Methylocystis sp. TaxID=1911079 RepID=UPI0025D21743|nr:peptide chain release factor N(5)-glutamine methyltransferase [Methylocystis sp.]
MKVGVGKKAAASSAPSPTRIEAIAAVAEYLEAAGVADGQDEARALLRGATGLTRLELALAPCAPLSDEESRTYSDYAARRAAREPVSRILGERGFWTLDLAVAPGVLDPRPDTETLVETALSLLAEKRDAPLSILDLGAGSGAIACALLSELPAAWALAVDLSAEACAATVANLARCGLANRASILRGRWAEALQGRFDLIVSNPPYVRTQDIADLEPEVRLHDPALALDGGPDGLECYREILRDLPNLLAEDGFALFEVGFDQAAAVAALLAPVGLQIESVARDAGGHERIVAARLLPTPT